MYQPKHFSVQDVATIDALVRAYPLASVVLRTTQGLPLSVDPVVLYCPESVVQGASLLGHIARANPLGHDLQAPAEVTAIFTGPRAYISPNWYPSKQDHHRAVPTYNYCTVVVHGRLRMLEARDDILQIVRHLTDQMEGDQPGAWSVDDAPPDYIEHMLKAIVGLAIDITEVQAKFKISQNREARDHSAVQMELEALTHSNDAQAMAALMNTFQPKP